MVSILALFLLVGQNAPTLGSTGVSFAGDGFLFRLSVPQGWRITLDEKRPNGHLATIASPAMKGTTMEVAVQDKKDGLASCVAGQKERTKKDIDLTAGTVASIPTYRTIDASGKPLPHRFAFIETPRVLVMLELKAKNLPAYAKATPSFESLVRSFSFVTDRVGRQP